MPVPQLAAIGHKVSIVDPRMSSNNKVLYDFGQGLHQPAFKGQVGADQVCIPQARVCVDKVCIPKGCELNKFDDMMARFHSLLRGHKFRIPECEMNKFDDISNQPFVPSDVFNVPHFTCFMFSHFSHNVSSFPAISVIMFRVFNGLQMRLWNV